MNDGGPAFPHITGKSFTQGGYRGGMSLRDYFAAAALQGLLYANHSEAAHMNSSKWAPLFAESAYLLADAMLAERSK